MSIYREDFVPYLETVRFDSKSWVSRQNCKTWQVFDQQNSHLKCFYIVITEHESIFSGNKTCESKRLKNSGFKKAKKYPTFNNVSNAI